MKRVSVKQACEISLERSREGPDSTPAALSDNRTKAEDHKLISSPMVTVFRLKSASGKSERNM